MMSSDKNQALFETYCRYLPNLYKPGIFDSKFSYPHLIHISPEYDNSRPKLFIVGQDPAENCLDRFGCKHLGSSPWDDNLADPQVERIVKELMDQDKRFPRRENGGYLLNTAMTLNQKINAGSSDNSFAYSNLVKVGFSGESRLEEARLRVCQAFPVLIDEIAIAEPEVVVFFTGPDFDCLLGLNETFPGLEFHHVNVQGIGWHDLCVLKHHKLPELTFRTYHPGYYNRSGLNAKLDLDKVLNLIASIVQGSKKPLEKLSFCRGKDYEHMNPYDVDQYGFIFIARKGDYSVWEHPEGKEYHGCDRKINYKTIKKFKTKDEALEWLEQMD